MSLIPLRSSYPETIAYLAAKYESYQKCVEIECWDDAFVNAHLIFIHWLYQKIWITIKHEPERARSIFSLHNFNGGYEMRHLLNAASGIELHHLKLEEKKLARIFRELHIGDDDQTRLRHLIDKRNSILHPSGRILCKSAEDLQDLINEQYDLATKISLNAATCYIDLAKQSFGDLTVDKFKNWNDLPEIEAYVVREFEVSPIDIDSIILKLGGAIV